jgi:hypothetical protein
MVTFLQLSVAGFVYRPSARNVNSAGIRSKVRLVGIVLRTFTHKEGSVIVLSYEQ